MLMNLHLGVFAIIAILLITEVLLKGVIFIFIFKTCSCFVFNVLICRIRDVVVRKNV